MPFLNDNSRGAVFMMMSMAGFIVSDTIMKLVAADLPLFQAIFLRGIFVALLMVLLAWQNDVLAYRPSRDDCVVLGARVIGEIGGMICLLNALINMPIVNATAIVQAIPFVVTLGAAFFFAERVGWRSYLAIAIGFFGVLIIIRPGSDSFSIHSLWAVGAVLFFTLRDLSTRRLSREISSTFAALVTSVAVVLVSGPVSLASPWQPVTSANVLLLGAAALCTLVGYLFSVMTMRVGDIGFVAPFRYSILLWALVLDILLFSQVPDQETILGSTIIVGMGVYALSRGRGAGRKPMPDLGHGLGRSIRP
ncbi:MAG: DMT family transporter [Pseudomonadota bacterium]